MIHSSFQWQDIGSLEDLSLTGIQRDESNQIVYESRNTTVLNQSARQIVVANNLEDITIINTEDAVYVGRTGESEKLKDIMRENPEEQHYFDQGRVIYKPWGTYELLNVNPMYVVRKVVVTEGKTIYAHQHAHRTEHWILVCGRARIILEGVEGEYGANDSIEVPRNTTHHGKRCDYEIIAESWELSAHKEGQSIVASGRHKGLLFSEYLDRIGKEGWGWKCQPLERFPLLVKLIDARENLSVQVHPDDAYALEKENEYGKNEMWYILQCEPDSCIYCGFRRDVTREEVEQAVRDDTILSLLNRVPIRQGEAFFIPAGTVHAIGRGSLICEIQQSSNCTYRLYDYKRKDKYGNYRELHLDKALAVMNYNRYEVQRFDSETIETPAYVCHILSRCKYFECISCRLHGTYQLEGDGNSFYSVLCVQGEASLQCGEGGNGAELAMKAGDSVFIPAGERKFLLEGDGELIITHI